jgi:hypothetical protein
LTLALALLADTAAFFLCSTLRSVFAAIAFALSATDSPPLCWIVSTASCDENSRFRLRVPDAPAAWF